MQSPCSEGRDSLTVSGISRHWAANGRDSGPAHNIDKPILPTAYCLSPLRLSPALHRWNVMPLLLLLSLAAFASSLSLRVLDPVIPEIARDLSTQIGTAALRASAIAFPCALGQPLPRRQRGAACVQLLPGSGHGASVVWSWVGAPRRVPDFGDRGWGPAGAGFCDSRGICAREGAEGAGVRIVRNLQPNTGRFTHSYWSPPPTSAGPCIQRSIP
jgi:hypothetical protein